MSAVTAILVDTLSPGAGSVLKLLVAEKVMPSPTLQSGTPPHFNTVLRTRKTRLNARPLAALSPAKPSAVEAATPRLASFGYLALVTKCCVAALYRTLMH